MQAPNPSEFGANNGPLRNSTPQFRARRSGKLRNVHLPNSSLGFGLTACITAIIEISVVLYARRMSERYVNLLYGHPYKPNPNTDSRQGAHQCSKLSWARIKRYSICRSCIRPLGGGKGGRCCKSWKIFTYNFHGLQTQIGSSILKTPTPP